MSHDPFKRRADEIRKAVELMEAMMAAERVKVERLTTAADGAKGLRPVKPYPSQTQHWNHSRYYTPEAARAALVLRLITYKTSGGQWGIPAGKCVLSIAPFGGGGQ